MSACSVLGGEAANDHLSVFKKGEGGFERKKGEREEACH